jgi:hypothetical protein
MFAKLSYETDKINNLFLRIYGIDLKKEGILNLGYFSYKKI